MGIAEQLALKPDTLEVSGWDLQEAMNEITNRGGWCPRMEQGSNNARWVLTIVWKQEEQKELL